MSTSCISFYSALLLAWIPAFAGMTDAFAADLPPELQNNGAPLEPLCFEEVSADEWLDVNACVKNQIVKLPARAEDSWAADKIGYQYKYKEDKSDATSYSYYKHIGQWNSLPVVLSYSSGGGSGQFTSLMSIERNVGKMRVLQGFAAGDRCNGGIYDAKISLGTLYYGQNITPIDFLQLAEDNPNDLQPYDDLEASAASCFGVAKFEDEKFVGVTLTSDAADQKDWTAQYKYQSCFNRLYRELLAKGKKELSVSELKEFTAQFNEECVGVSGSGR